MKIIENGSVMHPLGFKGVGAHIGIKKEKKDLALIYCQNPAVTVGTFTTNVVKAAPVLWDQKCCEQETHARVIAINSGVANACTGQIGEAYNLRFVQAVAKALEVEEKEVLICSTGVIGKQLPIEIIENGISKVVPQLSENNEAGIEVARAIMTTDTKPKHIAVTIEIDGQTVTIGGCCKGSGMIHPNMATMLGFITSDVVVEKTVLTTLIKEVVNQTFNMISVDRDTSTNDTVLMMTSSMANNQTLLPGTVGYQKFRAALVFVLEYLAKEIARDGEGATKLLEVRVTNCKSKDAAIMIAKSVCTSPLVKTAVYGNDANWGRLLCAMGYSGANFNPNLVELSVESAYGILKIVENGMATDYSEEIATKILSGETVIAHINMHEGEMEATAWGCDLTYDYIKINADYRS